MKVSLAALKALVVPLWQPTVDQVKNWMDSFRHKDDPIPISDVTNLQTTLNTLSASVIGVTPYKRVVGDYVVEVGDCVVAVGVAPELGESPSLVGTYAITLPDPADVPNKEFCIKRYSDTTSEIITIDVDGGGLIQHPGTGQFDADYTLPAWGAGYGAFSRWKSNGIKYEAIF